MPPACGEPERTEPGRRSGRLPARDAASDARLFVRAPQPVGIDPTRSVGIVLDIAFDCVVAFDLFRSEEHTSELQSLMRISYAVFCLKKKNTNTQLTRSKTNDTIQY